MKARVRGPLLGLVILAALASPGRAAICSSSVFVEAPGYPVGVSPNTLAVGDFNGDTFPDLATGSDYYGSLSVIFNDGNGSFGPPVLTPIDNYVLSLAAGDFDGDGNIDLAVGSYSEVRILLGHGDGTFDPPVDYAVPSSYVRSILTGHLDPGTSIDLVAATDSRVFVLLGAGDGTFGAPAGYDTGGSTRSIALGDFDGDDVTDLIAAQGVSVSLLLGLGNGTFAAPHAFVAGSDLGDIAAADFDEDGDLDVAVTSGFYVSILKGNGSGSFGAALQYPAGDPARIVTGDFTGDGLVDIAVLGYWETYYSPANSVSLLVGNGQGAFVAADSAYLSGYSGVALVSSDFDGDARPDLAVANRDPRTATVLLGDGRGGFIAARSIATPAPSNTLAQGDYNGDGIPDLAVAGSRTVAVLLGDGHGGFVTAFDEDYDLSAEAIVSGDFTGDGVLDLLVLGYYYEIRLFKGIGDGRFEAPTTVPASSYSRRAAVGDFNEDGKLDFAVTHDCCTGESIQLSLGNGNGTFQPPATLFADQPTFAVIAADLDGDSHLDLAATSPSANEAVVLLGLGDGTFQPPVVYPTQANPLSIAAGDLTGDGFPDLLVANSTSANVSLLPGDGDGAFGPGWTIAVGAEPVFAALGDFDDDGVTDFVTANQSGNTVSLFPGQGGGNFGSPVEFPVGREPWFISVGDFDRNGFADLAIASGSDSAVTVLANSRLGVVPLPASGACLGGAGVIQAFASGYGPIAYQWRKDGIDLSDGGNITGATTATLTIDPAAMADEGDYDVLVTDLCTTAASNVTVFTVSTPPAQPVIVIDTTPAPGVDGVASVADAPGHTFVWAVGGDAGALITAGQGTSQITFAAAIPGIVTLEVTEYSSPGCGVAAAGQVVPIDFFDVPPGHPFHAHIVKIARAGVTAGCGSGNYCPDTPVTRAQMSVFLLKGREGSDWNPPAVGSYFSDVPPGSFAAEWINYLASQGITGGCGGSLYCPDGSVTRAQMAVFILKTLGIYYPPYSPQVFDDVPQGSFAWDFINEIYNRGITGGCSVIPKLYCPGGLVSRGQMAVFITRAFLEP